MPNFIMFIYNLNHEISCPEKLTFLTFRMRKFSHSANKEISTTIKITRNSAKNDNKT